MTLMEHAKYELKMAGYFEEDSIYDGEIGKNVLELIECFTKQDHSDCSAGIVRKIFHKLTNYDPLTFLTTNEEEWHDIWTTFDGIIKQQNKRCPRVFRDKDSNLATCSDVYHFKTKKDGYTFTMFPGSSKTFALPGMPPKNIIIEEGTLEHENFIKNHDGFDPFKTFS